MIGCSETHNGETTSYERCEATLLAGRGIAYLQIIYDIFRPSVRLETTANTQ